MTYKVISFKSQHSQHSQSLFLEYIGHYFYTHNSHCIFFVCLVCLFLRLSLVSLVAMFMTLLPVIYSMTLSPSDFLTASLGSVSGTGEKCSILILLQDHGFHASLSLLTLRACSFWWAPLYFPMSSARASLILCLAPWKLSTATGEPSFWTFWPWIFWTHVRFLSWHSGEWVFPKEVAGDSDRKSHDLSDPILSPSGAIWSFSLKTYYTLLLPLLHYLFTQDPLDPIVPITCLEWNF